jgi:glycosyltransferase involved in cell wall biosynthesis
MRIGVDARELVGRPTGVGRYLAELLAQWSRDPAAAGDVITLFAPAPLTLPDGLIGAGGAAVFVQVVPGSGNTLWEQTRLGFAARPLVDVLFCPGYSAPILPSMPTAVALHDVSFAAHPEWFRPRESWRRRLIAWAAARRARRVLTLSKFSRDEIVRLLGISAEKIRVIPLAAGGFFDPTPTTAATRTSGAATAPRFTSPIAAYGPAASAPITAAALPASVPASGPAPGPVSAPASGPASVPAAEQTSERASTASEPLILYVGSIFNRRQLPLLLRGFAPIARDTPTSRLVIVGDNRTYPHEDLEALTKALGIAPQVQISSYLPDAELADLYRRARAFAFLSTYEGFALTPLEAMAAGVPAVLADTPVAREVFGDAALFVPIGDELAVTAALRALLDYDAARTHCLARGADLVRGYSWQRTAADTLTALREAARA